MREKEIAIVAVVENARGGWSMLLEDGREIGNYAFWQNAARIARYNGYYNLQPIFWGEPRPKPRTEKKDALLSK